MGAHLDAHEPVVQTSAVHAIEEQLSLLPQLDRETAQLVCASIAEVAADLWRPMLIAAILYGSVARGEERPLTDWRPSDVDILLVFEQDHALSYQERARVFAALGRAELRHLTAPREVRAMLATYRLEEWDDDFIASVARDGALLWARSQPPDLPPSLASVAQRLVSTPT